MVVQVLFLTIWEIAMSVELLIARASFSNRTLYIMLTPREVHLIFFSQNMMSTEIYSGLKRKVAQLQTLRVQLQATISETVISLGLFKVQPSLLVQPL